MASTSPGGSGGWLPALLCVLLLVAIVCVAWSALLRYRDTFPERAFASRAEFAAELRTGDVLCVVYRGPITRWVRLFTASAWMHAVLVLRTDRGDVDVLEAASYPGEPRAPVRRPLAEWLDLVGGRPLAWARYQAADGAPLPAAALDAFARHHWRAGRDRNPYRLLVATQALPRAADSALRDVFYCSEFVALALQEAGVLDGALAPTSHNAHQLVTGRARYRPGHAHAPPVRVLIDGEEECPE